MASEPLYDATYALSHALRTLSEAGTSTKPVELTQVLGQMHAGTIAAPVASAPMSPAVTGKTTVTATTAPLTYRVESKGKSK